MIFGITGKKRSGKDTVAKFFIEKGFKRYAFADPIKEMCKIMFLWDERHVNGELKEVVDERWGISPREAMQVIGTEFAQFFLPMFFPKFAKLIGRKFWVKRFEYLYKDNPDNYVISDVRFPHEDEELKKMGATIVKVKRPSMCSDDNHSSETSIDDVKEDFIIINGSDIECLRDSVDVVLDEVNLK